MQNKASNKNILFIYWKCEILFCLLNDKWTDNTCQIAHLSGLDVDTVLEANNFIRRKAEEVLNAQHQRAISPD